MSRWNWTNQATRGLTILMALAVLVANVEGAERLHASAKAQSQSRSVLTEITAMEVTCAGLEVVTLEVKGRTASGEWGSARKELDPEEYQVESEPFDRYEHDDEGNYITTRHRILYRKGSRAYVAGTVDYTVDRDGDPGGTYVDLSNVSWGFDLKKQNFWVQPRPDRMQPMPRMFRKHDWAGVRFLVPVPLKRFRPEEVRMLVEGRGGVLAGPEGPVSVVLLPDVFTFTGSRPRNTEAEKWIRKGASVLLEKNFPNFKEQPTD